MSGPSTSITHPWILDLILKFKYNANIRMVGLSHNCFDKKHNVAPHIQSFVYVLDRKGLDIITKNDQGPIFD